MLVRHPPSIRVAREKIARSDDESKKREGEPKIALHRESICTGIELIIITISTTLETRTAIHTVIGHIQGNSLTGLTIGTTSTSP